MYHEVSSMCTMREGVVERTRNIFWSRNTRTSKYGLLVVPLNPERRRWPCEATAERGIRGRAVSQVLAVFMLLLVQVSTCRWNWRETVVPVYTYMVATTFRIGTENVFLPVESIWLMMSSPKVKGFHGFIRKGSYVRIFLSRTIVLLLLCMLVLHCSRKIDNCTHDRGWRWKQSGRPHLTYFSGRAVWYCPHFITKTTNVQKTRSTSN